jgi:hypothetical protein
VCVCVCTHACSVYTHACSVYFVILKYLCSIESFFVVLVFILRFFCVVLGFELWASQLLGWHSITLPIPRALFCIGYFQGRVSQTIFLAWLWTTILLIAASGVTRITGVRHQCPASSLEFIWLNVRYEIWNILRLARCQWARPIILATQEAEIRRIEVWWQPGQIIH